MSTQMIVYGQDIITWEVFLQTLRSSKLSRGCQMKRPGWCSPNTPLILVRKIIAAIVVTVSLCIRLDKKGICLFYLDKAGVKNVDWQQWKLLLKKKRTIAEKCNSLLSLKTFLNCFTICWCRRSAPTAAHAAQECVYPGAFSEPQFSLLLLRVPHPRQAGEELSLSSLPFLQIRLFCLFSRLPGFLC